MPHVFLSNSNVPQKAGVVMQLLPGRQILRQLCQP